MSRAVLKIPNHKSVGVSVLDIQGYCSHDNASFTTAYILSPSFSLGCKPPSRDFLIKRLNECKLAVLRPFLLYCRDDREQDELVEDTHENTVNLCADLLNNLALLYNILYPAELKTNILYKYDLKFLSWASRVQNMNQIIPEEPESRWTAEYWPHLFRAYQSMVWALSAIDAGKKMVVS